MLVKPLGLVLAIFVLAFIAINLIADLLTPGGFNIGQTVAGIYGKESSKNLDVSKCLCKYSSDYKDYVCNEYCGDKATKVCESTDACLP